MMNLTHCGLVIPHAIIIWDNVGSGNGLLPDGTKPSPDPLLAYFQYNTLEHGSVHVHWYRSCSDDWNAFENIF